MLMNNEKTINKKQRQTNSHREKERKQQETLEEHSNGFQIAHCTCTVLIIGC